MLALRGRTAAPSASYPALRWKDVVLASVVALTALALISGSERQWSFGNGLADALAMPSGKEPA